MRSSSWEYTVSTQLSDYALRNTNYASGLQIWLESPQGTWYIPSFTLNSNFPGGFPMYPKITVVASVLAGLFLVFLGCASEQITSARLYIQQEDWDKAEEMLLEAMELEPDNPEVYYTLGLDIYARKGEWDKMHEMFQKARTVGGDKKLPSGATVNQGVEDALLKYWSEHYNRAADRYNKAMRDTGETRLNQLEDVIDLFETAKTIDPEEPRTYKSLVFAYIQVGDSDRVETTLEQALERNPEDSDLLVTAGNTFRESGDLERAVEMLEKAVRVDPGDSRSARALADTYYDLGDKDGAILAYKRALREDPENVDLHFNLGVLYLQVEDYDFAGTEFQTVLRLDPEDRDATVGIGEAYERMEQWEDAEFYYGKALRLDPEDPLVLRGIARVIYRQGRIEEAEEYLNRAKAIE
ncbi:MAG: tetratricopeptide repeat protein [Candidatus Neomarinimicrobiota bacterium]